MILEGSSYMGIEISWINTGIILERVLQAWNEKSLKIQAE